MLLPFGCCLQAEVVHCVLDKPGFSAVTVQPIVHAVEHALQILAVEFVHVPGEHRQAAVNGVIHLRVRFVLDLRECGSPRIGRVYRVLLACLRVNGRFVEDAMLGMGAPPSARNFFSFSSVRLWMASSVPFFSTGSFAENLTTSDASATFVMGALPLSVSDVCKTMLEASLGVVGLLPFSLPKYMVCTVKSMCFLLHRLLPSFSHLFLFQKGLQVSPQRAYQKVLYYPDSKQPLGFVRSPSA